MKLKDLTPKGIKINEAKVTPAKVHKIQKDLVKTIDLLKKNFPLYKAVNTSYPISIVAEAPNFNIPV